MSLKKIKFIIKLQINSDSTSLDPKISTVLGQRRISNSDIFDFIKNKIIKLRLKKKTVIKLNIWIIVFDLDDYIVYLKMPMLTSLINLSLYIKKNFRVPGYMNKRKKKKQFNYIMTPYMLYEIAKYKYTYELLDVLTMNSFYKKHIHSLKSKGINIYIC